ncbi:MAG: formate/nitrite transporter family protein [Caldilineaceae bacterium]
MADDLIAEERELSVDYAEPRKPVRRMLEHQIAAGLAEMERPPVGLFIAGLSAGLDVGFSLLLIAITLTHARGVLSEPVVELLAANMYAVGFIFVIVGQSQLFTEHTTLAALPVLHGRASLNTLARLWGIVYTSNLIGGAIFAALAVTIGPALNVIEPSILGEIARGVVDHHWWVILISGILAGWLMGLASWLVAAGRDTISQIVLVWLVTVAVRFAHLHHSITGTVEVLAGLFAGQAVTWHDFGHFLLWATLGNAFGGIFFVAVIKYSHVVRSQKGTPKVDLDESKSLVTAD